MSLQARHPDYIEMRPYWDIMEDTYEGEGKVKSERDKYLPPTDGMELDGFGKSASSDKKTRGDKRYDSYLKRAVFPEYVKDAVERNLGRIFNKPMTFELPESMEFLRERATLQGETLSDFAMRIVEQQLINGRLGVLADIDAEGVDGTALPYLALYNAKTITNWDNSSELENTDALNLVVLNESGIERLGLDFNWDTVIRYRVLVIDNVVRDEESDVDPDINEIEEENFEPMYKQGLFIGENLDFNRDELVVPTYMGSEIDQIPFVFINSKDLIVEPERPPLMPVANQSLTIYRGEADYRQNLHQQGQDTLVIQGGVTNPDEEVRVGTGASINVSESGDAKFIGTDSTGLREQREAITNDRRIAEASAGQVIREASDRESGTAQRGRVGAQTTTLNQISTTAAKGLQKILRIVATWMGADPETIVVTPNLDFDDEQMITSNLVDLANAKRNGLPLSNESIHDYLRAKGYTEKEFPEEMRLIIEERPNEDEANSQENENENSTGSQETNENE